MIDETVEELLPHIEFFIEQVLDRDMDAIDAVLAGVSKWFTCDGARAVAIVLAELLVTQRDRAEQLEYELGVAGADRDRFAKQYLEHRDRVRDLRALLNARTAASTAKNTKKKVA